MSQDRRSQGGQVTRVLKSPLTYLWYLHTAMQGEGRRRLACVRPEAETLYLLVHWHKQIQAHIGTLPSTVPWDGTLAHHTDCACGSAAPAQESRTLMATLVLGRWEAGRGASTSRFQPWQRWEHKWHRTTKELFFPSPFDFCTSACARGSHRMVLRLRAGAVQDVATAAAGVSTCSVSRPVTAARGTAFPCRQLPGHYCQSSPGGSRSWWPDLCNLLHLLWPTTKWWGRWQLAPCSSQLLC